MKGGFFFTNLNSPMKYNLHQFLSKHGYFPTNQAEAIFNDGHLEIGPASQYLEAKDSLANLLKTADFFPKTYIFHEDTFVFANAEEGWWIAKPALMNNGQGIRLYTNFTDSINALTTKTACITGPHIIQQYIRPPMLLERKKFSFRVFLVINNLGQGYLYKHGYLNFCQQLYSESGAISLGAHLTNEHLDNLVDKGKNQRPSWTWPAFSSLQSEIKRQISFTLLKLSEKINFPQDRYRSFSIFGFDFMLDSHARLWLLEANHCPCFPTSTYHPLMADFYEPFWLAVIDAHIEPLFEQRSVVNKHPSFELVNVS